MMALKYDYHKQNDYPGERVAERKRVADRQEEAGRRSDARVAKKARTEGLKADIRVARRGRMNDQLMESEIQRSADRAERIKRKRDTTDAIGLAVIAVLFLILLSASIWGLLTMQKLSEKVDSLNSQITNYESMMLSNGDQLNNAGANQAANQAYVLADRTRPTVISVSPANNEKAVSTQAVIEVKFSEPIDASTINSNTFILEQRTTPGII